MRARATTIIGLGLIFAAMALLLIAVPALAEPQSNPAEARQAEPVRAAPLGATVSVDLCAKAGTLTLPDSTVVDTWGFAIKPASVACTDVSVQAQVPGPLLEFTAGDSISITLHNALAEQASIVFPGQDLMPDHVGAAPGGSVAYSFTVDEPGTYLYESGTFSDTTAAVQVAMGLYGPLVVRPTTAGQAYGTPASAYDREAVLVLSEIDPDLHANPTTFNLLDYSPQYWLISGKAYPETDPILALPEERVLLRYVNAGLWNHTLTVLGMHQTVIAVDAYVKNYPHEAVSLIIPSGQTWDSIATLPAGAPFGTSFPLYSRNLFLSNENTFPGGMMTFITYDPTLLPYRNYLGLGM